MRTPSRRFSTSRTYPVAVYIGCLSSGSVYTVRGVDEVAERRFWSKVDRDGPGGCWVWMAGRHEQGYGLFKLAGSMRRAHRLSFELVNGPVPEGKVVCHSCDNPSCVNPAHLWAGSQKENMLDFMEKNPDRAAKPKKRRGPRKRDPGAVRSEGLFVRVTPGEMAVIKEKAAAAAVSVSSLVRDSIISGEVLVESAASEPVSVPAVDLAERRAARVDELVRQGVNQHLARIQAAREVT